MVKYFNKLSAFRAVVIVFTSIIILIDLFVILTKNSNALYPEVIKLIFFIVLLLYSQILLLFTKDNDHPVYIVFAISLNVMNLAPLIQMRTENSWGAVLFSLMGDILLVLAGFMMVKFYKNDFIVMKKILE